MKNKLKKIYILKKKYNIKKIKGTYERPRLSIFRSNKHIYVQLINDTLGKTLLSSSTLQSKNIEIFKNKTPSEKAELIGKDIAKQIFNLGITRIFFDKRNKPFIGRIKYLANGLKSYGILF